MDPQDGEDAFSTVLGLLLIIVVVTLPGIHLLRTGKLSERSWLYRYILVRVRAYTGVEQERLTERQIRIAGGFYVGLGVICTALLVYMLFIWAMGS